MVNREGEWYSYGVKVQPLAPKKASWPKEFLLVARRQPNHPIHL